MFNWGLLNELKYFFSSVKRQLFKRLWCCKCVGGGQGNAVCEDVCSSHKVKIFRAVAYDVLNSDAQILF